LHEWMRSIGSITAKCFTALAKWKFNADNTINIRRKNFFFKCKHIINSSTINILSPTHGMIRTSAALIEITIAILYLLQSSHFSLKQLSDIQSSSTPYFSRWAKSHSLHNESLLSFVKLNNFGIKSTQI
jgi:hypothetical protein